MSYYNTSAVDRLRKHEFLIDVSNSARNLVFRGASDNVYIVFIIIH